MGCVVNWSMPCIRLTQHVICSTQLTIPVTGARLIIGSDGLWDALPPKNAAHAVRALPAGQAANQLVYQVRHAHLLLTYAGTEYMYTPCAGD